VELSTRRMTTLEEVRAFVEGSESVDYQPLERSAVYEFVQATLLRFGYGRLGKLDKGVIRDFLVKSTGRSLPQIERLIRQYRSTGRVRDRRVTNSGRPFARVYSAADIRLLAEIDTAYDQMSGPATAEVLRRQFRVFGDGRFQRLSAISSSHIYNLRRSRTRRTVFEKTKATTAAIALRKAPQPHGAPGHVRVDTVHQGDRDGRKGLYLVNMIDEVTQFELVAAVTAISERFMVPVLTALPVSGGISQGIGQDQAPLPAQPDHHALRSLQSPQRGADLPQTRADLRGFGSNRLRRNRPERRQASQRSSPPLVRHSVRKPGRCMSPPSRAPCNVFRRFVSDWRPTTVAYGSLRRAPIRDKTTSFPSAFTIMWRWNRAAVRLALDSALTPQLSEANIDAPSTTNLARKPCSVSQSFTITSSLENTLARQACWSNTLAQRGSGFGSCSASQ